MKNVIAGGDLEGKKKKDGGKEEERVQFSMLPGGWGRGRDGGYDKFQCCDWLRSTEPSEGFVGGSV